MLEEYFGNGSPSNWEPISNFKFHNQVLWTVFRKFYLVNLTHLEAIDSDWIGRQKALSILVNNIELFLLGENVFALHVIDAPIQQ